MFKEPHLATNLRIKAGLGKPFACLRLLQLRLRALKLRAQLRALLLELLLQGRDLAVRSSRFSMSKEIGLWSLA